ncbi:carbohydrate ABC transporter permease [Paenibacillus agaridevorans]|uniref:Carbohydrate ABC transporter permease n=1 Tax=Paenibacillus agaridevorans TaxID=171404 RepID=A0A2R5EY67_9BACL|nr:carbohydrate ABC transporter permease [Paenibacillus agaridevorans]GBG10609.1 carbohydrate ABC transporter permease [Paenibacillus agaridevorans]
MFSTKWSYRIFDGTNILLLLGFSVLTFIPFLHVFAMSFLSLDNAKEFQRFLLWPTQWDFTSYQYIYDTRIFFSSLKNTVWITVVGTLINIAFTSSMAYSCSRRSFSGKRWIMLMVLFTMLFNGGLIPTYLVVNGLGLIDSLWAIVIPSAVSAFNMIVLKEFFEGIHESILESAKIDGCNDLGIFFRIVLPLSLPALATFTLFYAVANWNQYFASIIYTNSSDLWPLQVLLRQVVMVGQSDIFGAIDLSAPPPPPLSIQMATVMYTSLPILLLYPFLQKYFVKGMTLGAVKG